MKAQQETDGKYGDCCHPRSGRVLSGLILIAFGVIFFAKQLGVLFPDWLFTWPVFLIALGLYIGAKHMFRNPGWLILVFIGSIFLAEHAFPEYEFHRFIWPVIIIAAGLIVIFKPYRNRFHHRFYKNQQLNKDSYTGTYSEPFSETVSESNEDVINSVTIFGGVKKNIYSKTFKGGEVVCIMGGAEIDLSQADIQGTVTLEMIQIFGGAKLIIPSNWEIRSEAVVILGGIEDKRNQIPDRTSATGKILILRGTCIFGGIDIKNY
ncbi:MAG: DUF5668 domain-containing protein [Bacteroidota bacterium]|nr:DUF5668 domain-containing protein [Bacteroidota bacterium]